MGLSKRWLESKIEWLNRVMNLHNVDFAIATEKGNPISPTPKQKWVVFIEKYSHNRDKSIGMHRIGKGPEIGRCIPNTNDDIDKHDWVFHTRDQAAAKRIKGLVYSPDVMTEQLMFNELQPCVDKLKRHEGIHIYTTDAGEKWYATSDCGVNDQIRMRTKGSAASVSRYGWFYKNVMDQYGGEWLLHRLSLSSKEVIDYSVESSTLTGEIVPKALKKHYRLEETKGDSSITVLTPEEFTGLYRKKNYELLLDLRGVAEEGTVLDINDLLTTIVMKEFPGAYPNVNLDKLLFLIHGGEPLAGKSMLVWHGRKYYCTIRNKQKFSVNAGSAFPSTPY